MLCLSEVEKWSHFLKKSDIILWLFGVEHFFWFFELGDGCFSLGDNKPAWLEVRLVAKPDEHNLDSSRGGMGRLLSDPSDSAVADMMVSDTLTSSSFPEATVSSESFWMTSDFFKTELSFFCLSGVVGTFEQNRNMPVLEILLFQSYAMFPISFVKFFELMIG